VKFVFSSFSVLLKVFDGKIGEVVIVLTENNQNLCCNSYERLKK
jgi:hypothetical protein